MQEPLDWTVEVADMPATGVEQTRTASEAERKAVAKALDLMSCDRLDVRYHVIPLPDERFHMTGELLAHVTQACVVTLEPVAAELREPIDVTFWPARDVPPPVEGEVDIDAEPDPEPIIDGLIATGRVTFEHLAAAIDPYPRRPDATLEQAAPQAKSGPEASPFAVLAKLKPKP